MSWQDDIRDLVEDECADNFGGEWSITPDGASEAITVDGVFDDFVAHTRDEGTETVAIIEATKILEIRKSEALTIADLPGGSSSVFGIATRSNGEEFAILGVTHDLNNIFLYLGYQN
jgi:hypothetical protein